MTIQSMMKEERVFSPQKGFSRQANVNSLEYYKELYQKSIENPDAFWTEQAKRIDWIRPYEKIHYADGDFHKWFVGGKLNISVNCTDRHLKTKGNKTALLWIADDGKERNITYKELHDLVNQAANGLRNLGVQKGDRVCIYLPMIPELAVSMLACARIGAIHSIVFGGFSAASLKDRINDCEAKILITSDGSFRGGKVIPLKQNADEAIKDCGSIEKVVVVKRTENDVTWNDNNIWWHDWLQETSSTCEPEVMDAEDSLFILYTSGTTGKPKGVLHTQAGYLLYTNLTFHYIFDHKEDDIYFCTADIGWITGHSYIIYGPLSNGATSVMFEGIPTYPDASRFWQIVEKYKVSVFYTAPTAIRALMGKGDDFVTKHDRSSLRLLGTVGEPINPEAWMWYRDVIGEGRCPTVDTWWQTETGGILISPLPGATPLKPGSATLPFFGIEPKILREDGSEANTDEGGFLVIDKPWPSMLRTIWGDPDRYLHTYFGKFKGRYLTGDGARKDKDGYYWIMGRIDDVINVSGHRIGTAEVESALVAHNKVAEAAVVPFPHDVKGQALYAFVTLKAGNEGNDDLVKELRSQVAKEIGPIAKPDKIQFAPALPKTRSGKIMRRVLKALAEGKDDVGNTTTLADPGVVDDLKQQRQ